MYLMSQLIWGGRSNTFTINCSGFHRHGVDPAVFQTIFNQKDFRPVINYSIPTQVNISFTLSAILDVIWTNPFISWDPEKCGAISKLTVTTENLWLPDIFIVESWVPGLRNTGVEILLQGAGQGSVGQTHSVGATKTYFREEHNHGSPTSPTEMKKCMDVDQTPEGLSAYVTNDGHIVYNKPMQVTSICSLDIFYFPFDQQNCTLTFSFFLYTVENMLLGMEKEVWEIADTSRDIVRTQGEWELLGINKATPKMSVGSSLFDQIMFYVAIRRRPSLYVINLLVPSSFLISTDALSFYLPAESENRAPFKITLLLGYNVFLLMMNKLLPASGTPLISMPTSSLKGGIGGSSGPQSHMFLTPIPGVYFALCLSLMVVSLLETIFITYLLHMATTQPPPMPLWLYSLLFHCTSPGKCCPVALWNENTGPGLMSTHLPGLKEPGQLVGKELGSREAELNGGSGLTSTQLADRWVQFSHMMDTFLFRLYLIFLASSIITVIVLWNT
ncbi:5-hydroxytryptamine receptor 3C-like [Panthera pardus]|uniref:5-hydroxytryptamine receptor 3C-like n=1 Tax=Panthera pardus TaxID=9691 RepID=A0A9W2VNI8_PANPR|nr:5-hydroxytryptamine receptor 3C-like [Panthera pardus]